MSDNESTCSEASLGETISAVEDCLHKLSNIEQEKFIMFRPPGTDEQRTAIWRKYDIRERVCTEELPELLGRLSSAERDKPWFTWLKWVLFGH